MCLILNQKKIKRGSKYKGKGEKGGKGRKRQVTHGKPKKRDNKNDIYQTM